MKIGLGSLVRGLVTVGVVAILIHLVDLQNVAGLLASAHLGFLFAAFGVAAADRVLMIGKWYPLLRVQLWSVSVTWAARVYLASGIANYLLPASVGADAVRAAALGRGGRQVVEVGASIVAERVLGIIALGLMCLVALVVGLKASLPVGVIVPWSLAAVAGGVVILLVPMSSRAARWVARITRWLPGGRWSRLLERFGVAYAVYRRHPRMLTFVATLSFIEQGFPIVLVWLVARSLELAIGLPMLIVSVPLASFAGRLPISLSGLGVGDGAFVYLLTLGGVSVSDAVALALAGRIVEITVMVGPAALLWRDLVKVRRRGSIRIATGRAKH